MTINSEQLNSNRNLNEKVTTLIDTLQNSNLNKKANKKPATSNLTNNYLMICNSIGYFLNNSTEIEVVNDSEHCTIICAKCKQFLNLPVFERESNFLMPNGGTAGCLSKGLHFSHERMKNAIEGSSQEWNNLKAIIKRHYKFLGKFVSQCSHKSIK